MFTRTQMTIYLLWMQMTLKLATKMTKKKIIYPCWAMSVYIAWISNSLVVNRMHMVTHKEWIIHGRNKSINLNPLCILKKPHPEYFSIKIFVLLAGDIKQRIFVQESEAKFFVENGEEYYRDSCINSIIALKEVNIVYGGSRKPAENSEPEHRKKINHVFVKIVIYNDAIFSISFPAMAKQQSL